MKSVTMSDIALRAGVSRPTVSAVLNQRGSKERISFVTQQRVLEAAEELGFRRNELARIVVSGKSRMLGFLGGFPDFEHVGFMLGGAIEEAESAGYSMKVMGTLTGDVGRRAVELCAELRLSGVIALRMAPDILNYLHCELSRYEIPIVFLDMSHRLHQEVNMYTGIYSDDKQGTWSAVQFLREQGHINIGFISGDVLEANHYGCGKCERNTHFVSALQEWGLPTDVTLSVCYEGSSWSEENAEKAARQLLERKNRPTAIICSSDPTAMIVIKTANELRLKVPEELSVIGFGDFSMARYASPSLTTIAQPFKLMGAAAVRCLLQNEDSTDTRMETRLVPTKLILRDSTARAP